MKSWQLISRDGDLFNILRDTQTVLSTVELPVFGSEHLNLKRYESCLFTANDSEVVARYDTISEAIEGHRRLSKKYGLR